MTHLLNISFILFSCNTVNPSENDIPFRATTDLSQLLTEEEAERILGQPAHLSDSLTTISSDVLEYKSTYTADTVNQHDGKLGNLYFLVEEYAQLNAAKDSYASIKKSNEDHEGVKVLTGVGDEAYFHSDGDNFCFLLVRKGNKMFRMKVNKITSKTSIDDFNLVANRIASAL